MKRRAWQICDMKIEFEVLGGELLWLLYHIVIPQDHVIVTLS
jgi:hypothetical protein